MASEAWTRERVTGAIRRWHETRGVAPRKRDWSKPTFDASGVPETPAADVVLELFGKWSEAVRAAGLEPEKQERSAKQRRQQQELPDRAQREYLDDDLYYKSDEGQPPYYSPAGAYLAAAEIIAELYRWTALTGSPPTERDWLRDKQWPHPDVVIDVFGSWDDAMRDAGLDKFEPPPRADADIEELRARLAGVERELTTERQNAERELRSARRDASRAQDAERQARVDNDRAQEIARAAREEAKRARADAALLTRDPERGQTPSGQTPSGELDSLTERLIEVEARAEHLAEENERLRRALGQVREAMGVDEDELETEPVAEGEPRTVLEAVEQASQRVEHLVLLPDAFESAEDSPFRRPQLVLDALLKLDELSGLYAQPGGIGESIGSVARRLGLDWVPDTTDWGGTRGRHYEVSWNGRKFRLGPHVRLGTGAGAGSTARIYGFFFDGDDEHERSFVVGHVGRHLPDSTT
ncbi:MAG: homing endonuclease associated repeat-containing protein [Thermoleophilaceae bacterium]